MTDKPNSLQTLGLELNNQTMRAAQLNLRKGKPFLERLYELTIDITTPPSAEAINQMTMTPEGQALQAAMQKDLVVTCLNPSEVLVRHLEVKLKKETDIDSVLAFQSEPLLPYPVENAIVDRIKQGDTQDGTLLSVFAARKDHVQQHLELWHSLQVEPEVISCAPAALAAFANKFTQIENPQFVLHIGHTYILCALVKGNKLLAAQASMQGTGNLIQAIDQDKISSTAARSADLRSMNFSEISKEDYPTLAGALENMRLEVIRTLYALSKLTKGQEVSQILLTGEGAALNNLASVLCQSMNKPLVVPATDPNFNLTVPDLQKYAVPIGAALTGLPGCKEQINFRQGELAYPNPWRRYKQPVGIYLGLCLAAAIAFYFMGNSYVKYRDDQLRQEYSELLLSLHKPYTDAEKEYDAKATGKKVSELKEVPEIKSLSEEDIVNRLRFLQKDLQASPYYYPLLPNVPTISDVLAWLSTNPNVVSKDPKTGALKPLLQIESFNYTLVKRPDMTRKQEKYQVKIEIEFSSPTPKIAREFHDALIAPNSMVDPKGEVKWSTNRGLYRASFFLKDRTVYPSSS